MTPDVQSFSPVAAATKLADEEIGQTYEALVQNLATTHRQLEAWQTTYHAAFVLLQEQESADDAPPYTMKEACAALGLKEHKLRELIAAGKLAKMPDTGRRVLILPQEVRRFLRSCAA